MFDSDSLHIDEVYTRYLPVDFIKCQVIGIPKEKILENKNLLFTPVLEDECVIKYRWAMLGNIQIRVYENAHQHEIILSGSLHKFSNIDRKNYSDFTQNLFDKVIIELHQLLKIRPDNLRIIQLEYGVNIRPPLPSESIISHSFYHKRKGLSKDWMIEHCRYKIKIYNKAKYEGLEMELLRFEIRQTNWSEYRKLGVVTLQDFINYNKKLFFNNLIRRWCEVVFYDPTNCLPDKWVKYRNFIFWKELYESGKSDTTIRKHEKKLKTLNKEFGQNLQLEIAKEILNKLIKLQGV